jgi:hypothetical protein
MLVNLGGRGSCASTLEGREGMSEDDKMLLDYLEHVSCARVCCSTY